MEERLQLVQSFCKVKILTNKNYEIQCDTGLGVMIHNMYIMYYDIVLMEIWWLSSCVATHSIILWRAVNASLRALLRFTASIKLQGNFTYSPALCL